jgi:hypothetical protein
MTEAVLGEGPLRAGSPLRTPRAAAVAGIIFSALLITALVLLRLSTPEHPGQAGVWLSDSRDRAAVAIALNLVPFAGIAFLWFIGVLRDRIGEREDRFFATVFLGSGLLFVAMMFAAAAVSGGLIADISSGHSDTSTLSLAHNITMSLLNVYAMRMAAVFTLTTVTIARRTEIVSRWLTLAGFVCAVALLIGIGISPWAELVFPAWILALSLDVLAAGPRTPSGSRPARPADPGRLPRGHPAGARASRPGRHFPQKLSNSPFRTPPRKACHSSDVNRRTGPSESLLLRTPISWPGRLATSTQLPLEKLRELLTQ